MTVFPPDILSIAQSIVSAISSRMEASSTLGDAATEVIAEGLKERDERALRILRDQILRTHHMMASSEVRGRILAALDAASAAIRSGEQP